MPTQHVLSGPSVVQPAVHPAHIGAIAVVRDVRGRRQLRLDGTSLGMSQRLPRAQLQFHIGPIQARGLDHASVALDVQLAFPVVPRHVVRTHPSGTLGRDLHHGIAASRSGHHNFEGMHRVVGLRLRGRKVRLRANQLSFECADVAGDVHAVERQLLMPLREVMPHLLHVVHKQDFASSSDAPVGLKVGPLLVDGLEERHLQIQGQTLGFHLLLQPHQIFGHVLRRGHFVDRHQSDAIGQLDLGTRDVHIRRQSHQQGFSLSSSRLNGPLKLQKRPHFMAGDAVKGPIDLQRLGIQFVQRRREDTGQTTHQKEG